MKNIRCSLGSDKAGFFIEKFDMKSGWEQKIRDWVAKITANYSAITQLKMYMSDLSGLLYSGKPSKVINIR